MMKKFLAGIAIVFAGLGCSTVTNIVSDPLPTETTIPMPTEPFCDPEEVSKYLRKAAVSMDSLWNDIQGIQAEVDRFNANGKYVGTPEDLVIFKVTHRPSEDNEFENIDPPACMDETHNFIIQTRDDVRFVVDEYINLVRWDVGKITTIQKDLDSAVFQFETTIKLFDIPFEKSD